MDEYEFGNTPCVDSENFFYEDFDFEDEGALFEELDSEKMIFVFRFTVYAIYFCLLLNG